MLQNAFVFSVGCESFELQEEGFFASKKLHNVFKKFDNRSEMTAKEYQSHADLFTALNKFYFRIFINKLAGKG